MLVTIIIIIILIFLILWGVYLRNSIEVEVAVKILSILLDMYIQGRINEADYKKSSDKIKDNFNFIERFIYNLRYK